MTLNLKQRGGVRGGVFEGEVSGADVRGVKCPVTRGTYVDSDTRAAAT